MLSVTPQILLPEVWPNPRSLATTSGISVDVFSSPYLDVSVQAVPHAQLCIHCTLLWYCHSGFPHSEISGSMLICSSPKLIAACHVLHRLLMPRHSPCALSSLTSSKQAPYPSPRSYAQGSLIPLLLLSKSKQALILFGARNGAFVWSYFGRIRSLDMI